MTINKELREMLESFTIPAYVIIRDNLFPEEEVLNILTKSPKLMDEYAYLAKEMPEYYPRYLKELSKVGTPDNIIFASELFQKNIPLFLKMYIKAKPKNTFDWLVRYKKHYPSLLNYLVDNKLEDDMIYYFLKIKSDKKIKMYYYNCGRIDYLKSEAMGNNEFFNLREFYKDLPEEYQLGIII